MYGRFTSMKWLLSLVLLVLSGSLFWYGTCVNRMVAGDLDFILQHKSLGFFSTPWLWKGNWAYRTRLNPSAAIPFYKKAISRCVLNLDAWFRLAEMQEAVGNEEAARSIQQFLSGNLSQVSTWKWKELLLAYDLKEEASFSKCYNFTLSRLPHHIQNASFVAYQFWGDWMQVLHHVNPDNYMLLLEILMRERQMDASLALWTILENDQSLPEDSLTLRFTRFLLREKNLEAAKRVWATWSGIKEPEVYNGGFEQEPLNISFGWRFQSHPEVEIGRTSFDPYAGRYALHLHFSGTSNVRFHHVSQIIPVEPEKSYRLDFVRRAQRITTDQGVYMRVSGYRCSKWSVTSDPVLGDEPWKLEGMDFQVPEDCQAVLMEIRRDESLMFDNKISGDYLMDDLRLISIKDRVL